MGLSALGLDAPCELVKEASLVSLDVVAHAVEVLVDERERMVFELLVVGQALLGLLARLLGQAELVDETLQLAQMHHARLVVLLLAKRARRRGHVVQVALANRVLAWYQYWRVEYLLTQVANDDALRVRAHRHLSSSFSFSNTETRNTSNDNYRILMQSTFKLVIYIFIMLYLHSLMR